MVLDEDAANIWTDRKTEVPKEVSEQRKLVKIRRQKLERGLNNEWKIQEKKEERKARRKMSAD